MPSTAVEEAKNTALIAAIGRKERLAAWGDYLGFAVSKGAGVCALITGGLELVAPNILPLHLQSNQSEAAMGIGLALLAGSKVVKILAKVTNALKQ